MHGITRAAVKCVFPSVMKKVTFAGVNASFSSISHRTAYFFIINNEKSMISFILVTNDTGSSLILNVFANNQITCS